jgi:S1-C subfamily serine protease
MIQGGLDLDNLKPIGQLLEGKTLEGRNDYLDVTFAKNRIRVPAKLARTSDRADVAMVKIDLPRALKKCDLNDNYDTIKPGDAMTVMGYPGVSPVVYGAAASQDVLGTRGREVAIPDPTVTPGNIGRVVRGRTSLTDSVQSVLGDVYQLTANATGQGNSGGPVFDDHGRVIGLFTLTSTEGKATVTFAVPIRYGMELMGVNKVM